MLSENISTPIYVECCEMYQSKVCVQEFSYFVSGLDIQLEQSEYDSLAVLYAKNICCRWQKYKESCTVFFKQSIGTNGLVDKESCSEFGNLGSSPD